MRFSRRISGTSIVPGGDYMSDLISRCELFNRLATIPAPPEANDLKAEIYKVIQSMETVDQEAEQCVTK